MKAGRRRPLSADERRLWADVARSIRPLSGRAVSDNPVPTPPEPVVDAAAEILPKTSADAAPRRALPPPLKPLAPLESKTSRSLARGHARPDAALDLHGMTQAGAHGALRRFLHRSQADGCRIVLVVTGKGRPEDALRPGDRGVLRRVVPQWLALPDLRAVVLGWAEAGPRQGGAGALYVRIRRAGRV